MANNTLFTIKNCSQNDAWAITYALHKLIDTKGDLFDLKRQEESQILYISLVNKLNLQTHAKKIYDAFIKKLIKEKNLRK